MASFLILSIVSCLNVVIAERLCTWNPPNEEWQIATCVPYAPKQCELYNAVKHRIVNDEYTVNYFEQYLCKRTCLTKETRADCNGDNNCNWIGPETGTGHCAGITHTYENNLIDQSNFLKRQALYSYTIK